MFPLNDVAQLYYNVVYHRQKDHYGVALLRSDQGVIKRNIMHKDKIILALGSSAKFIYQ